MLDLWSKSFNTEYTSTFKAEYIFERKAVGKYIRKLLTEYYSTVTISRSKETKVELIKQWRMEHMQLFDLLKKNTDIESFCYKYKVFYKGQKSNERKGYVSDQISQVYESWMNNQKEEDEELDKKIQDEITFIHSGDTSHAVDEGSLKSKIIAFDSDNPTFHMNRSGIVRSDSLDEEVENCPKIRKIRSLSAEIKSTCAKLSSSLGISVENSRKAVQIVCKYLYGHNYYLSKEEQEQALSDTTTEPHFKKQKASSSATREPPPVSADDYKKYEFVLPNAKTIYNYKQLQATEAESDAAVALATKSSNIKVTLHFDTTRRNNVDGEWPSLILNFSNNLRYRLRPIFFAYETKKNISDLIIETYKRLEESANIRSHKITAKELWEKTDAFMTDAVMKNLGVEKIVAERFRSEYKPYRLLCKSHTVEKIDDCNLKVLSKNERMVNLREKLENFNPALKPFFRGKKAVVLAGIHALTKLVSHDASGKTTSCYEEFEYICEREGYAKSLALYHERRFTKLGQASASILHAKPVIDKLLSETNKSNLLVQSCRLFMDLEFFLTEIYLLSYLTHNVTFPFLNAVETSNHKITPSDFSKIVRRFEAASDGYTERFQNYWKIWCYR